MMPKAPPALPSCIYCNSYSELCRETVGTRCPLFFLFAEVAHKETSKFPPVARVDRFYSDSRLFGLRLALFFLLLSFLFTFVLFIGRLEPFFVCERQRGQNNCAKRNFQAATNLTTTKLQAIIINFQPGTFVHIVLILTLTLKVTLKNPPLSRLPATHVASSGQSEPTNNMTEISIFQGELCGVDQQEKSL